MWNRDLTTASEEGHVDFPRLAEGGVNLQCFTIVTRGYPLIGGFPLFAAWRRWPREARRSEWTRALWQIELLEELCRRSSGKAAVVHTRSHLDDNFAQGRLSAVIGVEGAHAVEGDASRVAELHRRGVRFMSLTHLSNNELGGSSFPLMPEKGLTELGRKVLDEMDRIGMPIDVAHASRRTSRTFSRTLASGPSVAHWAHGAAKSWRNLPDEALRAIAGRGGVVGVIFATVFLGGRGISDVARHIEHAVNVMGEDGVALGSDFDGMVPLPRGMRDVRDLHLITSELLRRGHPEGRVEKVIGGNWRRFFGETLGE